MKTKLTYDDIKLNGKVKIIDRSQNGEIVAIENWSGNEPVFTVKIDELRRHYGLKYILKNYIQTN